MLNNKGFGEALALVIHDLRNPAATLAANVDFLREALRGNTLGLEALDDVALATQDLRAGLTRLSWLSASLEEARMHLRDGDAEHAIRTRFPELVRVSGSGFLSKGGGEAGELVAIFVENAKRHDRKAPTIHVARAQDHVRIFVDDGAPLDAALAEHATELGQQRSLQAAGGRYARFCGFAAAEAFLGMVGGTLRFMERSTENGVAGRVEIKLRAI